MRWSETFSEEILFGKIWVSKGDQMGTEGKWLEIRGGQGRGSGIGLHKISELGNEGFKEEIKVQSQVAFVLQKSMEET